MRVQLSGRACPPRAVAGTEAAVKDEEVAVEPAPLEATAAVKEEATPDDPELPDFDGGPSPTTAPVEQCKPEDDQWPAMRR